MTVQEIWQYALFGLGTAAIYALLAYTVTINFKATGFISFANGAVAMLAAYEFLELREFGLLVAPVPGVQLSVRLAGHGTGVALALALAVASAVLVGALSYVLIFRWLRNAPPLARVVASIGLMVTLQALAVVTFGTNGISATALVTSASVSVFGGALGVESLGIFAIAGAFAVVLFLLYRYTQFGLKTSASSESPTVALLCGFRPIRLEFANWILSSALCGVAGCLATSFVSLDPSTYTLLIVPALAVAVAGRFTTFGVSLLVALLLAILQSEAVGVAATYTWFPQQGIPDILPFVFIVVILTLRGSAIPSRGAEITPRLPAVGSPARIGLGVIAWVPIGIVLSFLLTGEFRAGLIQSLITASLCLSIVVVTGLLGQISLAQMEVAGLGAFVLAHILLHAGLIAPVALLVSGLAAIPLGVAAAVPALRIRGLQLAIVTLAGAVGLDGLVFSGTGVSGGFAGITFPAPKLFGLNLGIQGPGGGYPRVEFALFALAVLVGLGALVANVRRQPFGRQMLAVRASERVAAANGIGVVRTKLMGFAFASLVAGVGGAMIGYEQTVLTASSFTSLTSLSLLAVAFLGGVGYVSGAVTAGVVFGAAGLVFTILNHFVNFDQYETLVVGLGLILTAILNPDGAVSVPVTALRKFLERFPRSQSRAAILRRASQPLSGRTLHSDTVIEVRDFTVRYGGTTAVAAVSIDVGPREIVGLIGPNGAGKTSLVDGVTGFTAGTGSVVLDGEEIGRLPAYRITRKGLARTFQGDELLSDVTVLENLSVGATAERSGWSMLLDLVRPRVAPPPADALAALEFVGLLDDASELVRSLDPRKRKLLGIARALAHRPKLLVVDEPGAGLDNEETAQLAALLMRVRDLGMSVLVIDHDMDLIMGVSERIFVLESGQVIAAGPPHAILRTERVVTAYLGPAAIARAESVPI